MIFFPNAKINIGLFITEKRNDGYHNLETIFYPLSFSDILEIQPAKDGQINFRNTGIQIPAPPKENLCYKAWEMLQRKYGIPEVNFHLHKLIPYGSGLGGGSSDASFTLKALNKLFELNLDEDELKTMAEQLGSDCPFFIDNTPSFAWEKGNHLSPLKVPLKGFYVLIVVPPFHIDTRTAYQGIKPKERKSLLHKIVETVPVEEWQHRITNDFEDNIINKFPEMASIKNILAEKGALFTSLSGSGSAIYGIFRDKPEAGKELNRYHIRIEEL
jgi:4-diphosphocytidyl-2-C-methyl-D-erythritol kinase